MFQFGCDAWVDARVDAWVDAGGGVAGPRQCTDTAIEG
jgi:hypothetical protein